MNNHFESKLVVAVDDTPVADDVMGIATEMAKHFGSNELHIVHVVNLEKASARPLGFVAAGPMVEAGRTLLDRLVGARQKQMSGRMITHLAYGVPAAEILRIAEELEADAIIVGTRDRGPVKRALLGSVATKVMQNALCAVLVARAKKIVASPAVEPPCAECVERRRASKRADLWCERHATKHAHGHLHYEYPPPYGVGSMLVRP